RESPKIAEQYAHWLTPGEVGTLEEIKPGMGAVIRRGRPSSRFLAMTNAGYTYVLLFARIWVASCLGIRPATPASRTPSACPPPIGRAASRFCEVCDRCCNRKRQWPFHHAGLTLFDNRALVCDLIRHIFSARSSASFGFMECQKALSPSDLCHAL